MVRSLSKRIHSKTFEQGSTQKSQQTRAKKTSRCRGVKRESGERHPK